MKECNNCIYLEADKEIINEHIEKEMRLEAELNKKNKLLLAYESCVKLRIPKPLAQYLADISDMGVLKTQAFFERALEAYESTENVMINIIKKKVK